LGDQVLRFCHRRDLQPKISFRSAQLETIQALVRAGLGLSLIPAMATQSNRSDLPEYRFMQPPKPMRRIAAVWPKQRPPNRAANEFLKMLSGRIPK
jgi:LysR family transcriptional regulator, hydrogen peroxide-inducible genes activator